MSRKEVSVLGVVGGLGPTPQPALLSLVCLTGREGQGYRGWDDGGQG